MYFLSGYLLLSTFYCLSLSMRHSTHRSCRLEHATQEKSVGRERNSVVKKKSSWYICSSRVDMKMLQFHDLLKNILARHPNSYNYFLLISIKYRSYLMRMVVRLSVPPFVGPHDNFRKEDRWMWLWTKMFLRWKARNLLKMGKLLRNCTYYYIYAIGKLMASGTW